MAARNVFEASSTSDFSFYDRLRASLATTDATSAKTTAIAETSDESSVIQVQLPRNNSHARPQPEQQQEQQGPSTVRLLNIACTLGLSRGGAPVLDSFDQVKAALMAQHHFNHRIDTVVPNLPALLADNDDGSACNVKLLIDFFDSQRNPRTGAAVLVDEIYPQHFPFQSTVVLGSERSAVSVPLAMLNSVHEIPQISHASTSTELDDRSLFPSFGRVIPSNQGDAAVAIEYFQTVLQTTHLGILHVNDQYGTAYRTELERAASKVGITTRAVSIEYQVIAENMRESIADAADFLAETGYRHFMGVIFTQQLELLLDIGLERGIMGPGKLWLFGDGVFSNSIEAWRFPTNSPQSIALHGSGILTIGASSSNGSYEQFVQAFTEVERNPQFRDYFATKSPRTSDVVTFESNYTTFKPSDFSELLYDAVMAIGIAACHSPSTFFTGKELFSQFLTSDFVGASGRVRIDPSTGGRAYDSVTYVILNTQVDDENDDGFARNKVVLTSEYSKIKTEPQDTPVTGWNNLDNVAFQYSDSSFRPPPPLPPRIVQDAIHPMVYGLIAGVAVLVMLGATGFAVWTFAHRNCHVVKVSQPNFLLCICLGVFLMSSAVVTSGIVSPPVAYEWAKYSCMSTVWLFGFGFSVVFAALFTKTRRINKIFGNGRHFLHARVHGHHVALPGVLLILGNLFITAVWQVSDPFRYEPEYDEAGTVDVYGRPLDIVSTCTTEKGTETYYIGASTLILLAIIFAALIEAYKARQITMEYSESVYIALSTAANFQGIALAFPAYLFVSDSQTTYVIRAALVLLIASTTLILIFVPKVWHRTEHERRKKKRAEEKRLRLAASALVNRVSSFVHSHLHSNQSDDNKHNHHAHSNLPQDVDHHELEEISSVQMQSGDLTEFHGPWSNEGSMTRINSSESVSCGGKTNIDASDCERTTAGSSSTPATSLEASNTDAGFSPPIARQHNPQHIITVSDTPLPNSGLGSEQQQIERNLWLTDATESFDDTITFVVGDQQPWETCTTSINLESSLSVEVVDPALTVHGKNRSHTIGFDESINEDQADAACDSDQQQLADVLWARLEKNEQRGSSK